MSSRTEMKSLYRHLILNALAELAYGTRFEIQRLGDVLVLDYGEAIQHALTSPLFYIPDPKDWDMADGPVIARGMIGATSSLLARSGDRRR